MLTKEESKVVKIELILRDMKIEDLAKELGVSSSFLRALLCGATTGKKCENYIRENYLGNREKYGL